MSERGYQRHKGETGVFYGVETVECDVDSDQPGPWLMQPASRAHEYALAQLTPDKGERDRGWKVRRVRVRVEIEVEAAR